MVLTRHSFRSAAILKQFVTIGKNSRKYLLLAKVAVEQGHALDLTAAGKRMRVEERDPFASRFPDTGG
jgi:hypothetical protein